MAFPALRRGGAAILAAPLTILLLAGSAAAVTTDVECGLFHDYVAPDPVAPATGSITFGFSGTPETIAADATIVPPADTNLAGLGGGAPTALTVVRDGGVITSLSFAPSCDLTGNVTFIPDLFGPGTDGYMVSDRLVAPVFLMAINDGLAALIPTAEADGVPLSLTFTIDAAAGTPSAFHASLTLVGEVKLRSNGDIVVGSAVLPNSTISDAARDQLREAHRLGVEATVAVTGDGGPDGAAPGGVAMAITLDVTFAAPERATPTPSEVPDTATSSPPDQADAPQLIIALLVITASSAASFAVTARLRTRSTGSTQRGM